MVAFGIYAATTLLAAATLLPWLPWSHGLVRACDYPRLQIATLAAVLIPIEITWGTGVGAALVLQLGVIVIQMSYCWRFTRLHALEVPTSKASSPANSIRILSTNVKMSNRRFEALVELVDEFQPDVLIAMEVDQDWIDALRPLRQAFPHAIGRPATNSYGILVLSKLELVDPELRFLVFDEVPSVRTSVRLRNGELIRLYAAHPEPPVPYEDTLGRDGELILIAKELASDRLPGIVAGDLNDVAWSRTTARFQRLSKLLDPRVGRGFFNTFDARYPFLRWPLDHVFHDARFRLVRISRLRDIGSDHFPLMFELALFSPSPRVEMPEAEEKDRAEATDVIRQTRDLDRGPVGTNWEEQQ
jgi:endonuclease/exonuclease/phosphatase (EEP) superfamily protein YafD